jgi:ASC-1-like (ASCH) protein
VKLRIKQVYLDLIAKGLKTLEIRVAYPWLKPVEPGKDILFMSGGGRSNLRCHVTNVRSYSSFKEMLDHEDVDRALPGVDSSDALKLLTTLYPPHKERLGVVVIELGDVVERHGT